MRSIIRTAFVTLILSLIVFASQNVQAATLIVSTTADAGAGSLRQAILDATSNAAANTVNFNIPTSDPGYSNVTNRFTITLVNQLPDLPLAPITIENTMASGLTVKSNGSFRVFTLVNSAVVNITNLTMSHGGVAGGLGGGIYMGDSAVLFLTNSTLTQNSASNGGGGIYINDSGTLHILNSTISNNSTADGNGGAIFVNNSGTLNITSSTVNGNTATVGGGGAIYNGVSGTINATNVTLNTNNAGLLGGAINNNATLTMSSSTVSGNTAGSGGGGIYNGFTATVNNSIVALNAAPDGPDVLGRGTRGQPFTGNNNLIGNADGSEGFGPTTNQLGSIGSPINPLLGVLQDNGGPTFTQALLEGSPAIDAGATALATDQRGISRPQEGDGVGVAQSDIGAFEKRFAIDVDPTPSPSPSPSPSPVPVANDDHYFTEKNVQHDEPASGVLSNDTGANLVASPVAGGATTAGGTYTLNANGSFTYTPANGFTGTDGFNYTVTNSGGNDTAHVELTVTDPATLGLRISEFRLNGPNGSTDEFFEIYNTSPLDHVVGGTSPSNSGGYGVFASAGNGVTSNTVTLVCLIPNGTVIPARGYVLCTGSSYSLGALGAMGSSTGGSAVPAISGVPTATGNFSITNGTLTNPGAYTSADVPNDAGLLLANVGTNTVGASTDLANGNFGFNATGVSAGSLIVFDRVGFAPYGSGAPLQTCQLVNTAGCGASGSARPPLADNYCETTAAQCLRPVGDASTANHGTTVAYGDSGQYSLLRRQSTDQSATIGNVPQDTANNADDILMVSPLPAINIAFSITNFPTGAGNGLVSVLGAAGPQNNAAPADLPETSIQSSLFDSSRSSSQAPNVERRYTIESNGTTVNNNPTGSFLFRFGFRNTSTSIDINQLRFRVDNLSVPCGQASPPAGTGLVGSGNARNLNQTLPNCQGSEIKTAVLKMLNMATELVSPEVGPAAIVRGSVIEDTDGTNLAPNGGGINNSLVRTGITQGSLTGEFTTVVPAGSPGPKFYIAFRMGVVKGGGFRFLFQPEGSSATPIP